MSSYNNTLQNFVAQESLGQTVVPNGTSIQSAFIKPDVSILVTNDTNVIIFVNVSASVSSVAKPSIDIPVRSGEQIVLGLKTKRFVDATTMYVNVYGNAPTSGQIYLTPGNGN